MDIRKLENLGLTYGESRVYLALLKLGSSTIGKIIKEANVSNSKVYDILDRLNKKGLIGAVIKNNTKNFEAKDPSRLMEFIEIRERELEEKRKNLKEIIPELQQLQSQTEIVQEAEILQGIQGVKTFMELILNKLRKGESMYVLGVPSESNELMQAYFDDWHERRARKGVECKMLYNQEAKSWAEIRTKSALTKIRILPKEIKTPTIIDIAKDYVATFVFGSNPFCFVMKNLKMADSYREYFELLWNTSKPL